jgi:hypothetical protein
MANLNSGSCLIVTRVVQRERDSDLGVHHSKV